MANAFIYPFLRYHDARGATDWLQKAFGFEAGMVVDGEGGSIAHAQLRLGEGMIMVGTGKSPKTRGQRTTNIADVEQGLYGFVPDVDAHHQRAKAGGAAIVREVEATEYGSREYSAFDYEGYYWSFGTYGPGREGAVQ